MYGSCDQVDYAGWDNYINGDDLQETLCSIDPLFFGWGNDQSWSSEFLFKPLPSFQYHTTPIFSTELFTSYKDTPQIEVAAHSHHALETVTTSGPGTDQVQDNTNNKQPVTFPGCAADKGDHRRIADPVERRKLQNRLAQRAYRK